MNKKTLYANGMAGFGMFDKGGPVWI